MTRSAPHAEALPGGYRPDPAREARMVIYAFFGALVRTLPAEPRLADRLRRRHRRLVSEHRHRAIDDASRHHLAMALAVLAGYQELSPGRADEVVIPRLREAFVEPLRRAVEAVTREILDAAPDPLVATSRARERWFFGSGFEFTHPDDDRERHTSQVVRCYYHEILRSNRAEHLTPILCAFDANWIDAIAPERHGFEFRRPTTIGTGGGTCPFQFRRVKRE